MVGRSPVAEAWILALGGLLRQACQDAYVLVPAGFAGKGRKRGGSAPMDRSDSVAALKPGWRRRPARCFRPGQPVAAGTVTDGAPAQRRWHRHPSEGGCSDEVGTGSGGKGPPKRRKSGPCAASRARRPDGCSGLTDRGPQACIVSAYQLASELASKPASEQRAQQPQRHYATRPQHPSNCPSNARRNGYAPQPRPRIGVIPCVPVGWSMVRCRPRVCRRKSAWGQAGCGRSRRTPGWWRCPARACRAGGWGRMRSESGSRYLLKERGETEGGGAAADRPRNARRPHLL